VCNEFNFRFDYLENTKDVWARDFMPIQISKDVFIQYDYAPDYLKKRSRIKYKTNPDEVIERLGIKTTKTKIILDGGNVVKSENAIILTDKIFKENEKQFSSTALVKELHSLFEVEKVVVIPWDDVCEFGHSDGMLRFIGNDNVLISGFYENADLQFKKQLLKPLEKAKINYDWLRVADKEAEKNLYYVNFLQTKEFVLIPGVNKNTDSIAVNEIAKFYSNYVSSDRIRILDMKETMKWGGALNCISWNIKTIN